MIVEAVDALPTQVDAETRGRAETTLLELVTQHDARDLRQLGKGILDMVDPQLAESHDARVLAREEALVDDGHGTCHGRFTVPSHVGKCSSDTCWRCQPRPAQRRRTA